MSPRKVRAWASVLQRATSTLVGADDTMHVPFSAFRGSSWAFRARVALLLAILAIVVGYAIHDRLARSERTRWQRTLTIALVVVDAPGVSESALARLRARIPALEAHLAAEFARYRRDAPRPFAFVVYGPLRERVRGPEHDTDGLAGVLRYALALLRFTRDVDDRAHVPSRGFDARLYLLVQPPAKASETFVEGASQQGGRVGFARAELADESVDFALFVAVHELLHTLGASDKYDATGQSRIPDGLADPTQVPRYPQARAEIMSRNRVIAEGQEEPPDSIDQLGVGPATAREIGWLKN